MLTVKKTAYPSEITEICFCLEEADAEQAKRAVIGRSCAVLLQNTIPIQRKNTVGRRRTV